MTCGNVGKFWSTLLLGGNFVAHRLKSYSRLTSMTTKKCPLLNTNKFTHVVIVVSELKTSLRSQEKNNVFDERNEWSSSKASWSQVVCAQMTNASSCIGNDWLSDKCDPKLYLHDTVSWRQSLITPAGWRNRCLPSSRLKMTVWKSWETWNTASSRIVQMPRRHAMLQIPWSSRYLFRWSARITTFTASIQCSRSSSPDRVSV